MEEEAVYCDHGGGQMTVRHILGLSGGKDSAALAIYMKEQGITPKGMEYFFCDTGVELPEVYAFLDKMEVYLGQEIARLGAGAPGGKDFFHYLKMHDGMLPQARRRWCTRDMKLKHMEQFVGDDQAITYVGIRADEHRKGYLSHKPNISAEYPFIENDIVRKDVFEILERTVGIPEYYKWRSRSGCYFCFFQRRDEWIGLHEEHPDLFQKAVDIENSVNAQFTDMRERYTWIQGESLAELLTRKDQIIEQSRLAQIKKKNKTWQEIVADDEDDDDPEEQACAICSL